jgi:LacI family transcriptional regulator
VASRAGVSAATVSRVLNGSPVPSQATRAKVLAAARELNYRPDPAGRSLRQGVRKAAPRTTGAVGLLYYGMDDSVWTANDFYMRVFVTMERTAERLRQHLLVARIHEEQLPPRMVSEMKVDGVVIVGHIPQQIAATIAGHLPVVLFNYRVEGVDADCVLCDNRQGIRAAVRYLFELGHRRIAFLGRSEEPHLHVEERLLAYREVLRELSLTEDPRYEPFTTGRKVRECAERNVDLYLALGKARPTAFVCAGDVPARAFAHLAGQRSIRIPEEVSVVGFDDTISATSEQPALTTIHQPLEEMAQVSIETLIQAAAGGSRVLRRTLLDAKLVVRDSCAPPARA